MRIKRLLISNDRELYILNLKTDISIKYEVFDCLEWLIHFVPYIIGDYDS